MTRYEAMGPRLGRARQPSGRAGRADDGEQMACAGAAGQQQAGLFAAGLWSAAGEGLTDAGRVRLVVAPSSRDAAMRQGRGRLRARARRSRRPFVGSAVGAEPAAGRWQDLAWDVTLRQAAIRRAHDGAPGPLALTAADLMRRRRVERPRRLWLLVVDGSGSMGRALTALAGQVAEAVLADAYRQRAGVALIVLQAEGARLVCEATGKVDRACRALASLALGGTTPLAAGLGLARRWLARRAVVQPSWVPSLVAITDGRANVGAARGYQGVLAEVEREARRLSAMGLGSVVLLDPTPPGSRDVAARRLAGWLGAERVVLRELGASFEARELLGALRGRGRRATRRWRNGR